MKRLLGRVSEWSVTHPTQTVAGVIALVAIIGVIGALRLTPDAGTDKLVDHGSSAFEGTQEFRERFGDEAIVVLARQDLKRTMLTKDLSQLLKLEACLSGNAPPEDAEFPPVCREIAGLGATRVVFGPATFLNQAATEAGRFLQQQFASTQQDAQRAAQRAARAAAREGLSEEEQAAAASAAQQQVFAETLARFQDLVLSFGDVGLPSLENTEFIQAVVFDSRRGSGIPKSRFGYLFPSSEGALVSIRLEPGLDDETRRKAIGLIREATENDAFALRDGTYEVSGVPVVVEGLADELGGEIFLLLGVALVVMALTLMVAFGPPLRLLPLFVALGGSAMAFGLLSIVGGSLTMASVAVLPVVIGLGVDYAIQLQARFREAAAAGERPAAAAVIAAVRGGPVIATAALATSVGFLSLVLSPIPMVREFAFALVAGILSALAIALTAGLAALSSANPVRPRAAAGSAFRRVRVPEALQGAGEAFASAGGQARSLGRTARRRFTSFGRRALATAITVPGRVLATGVVLAVLGWGLSTQTEVVSDVRELVPGNLPALQGVDELQEVTGVSGEVGVTVRGDDVTTPEALAWMRDFKQRVLEEHGFAGEFPDCRAEGTELCPGPALPDLLRSDAKLTQKRIDAVLGVVPDYFLQAILSRPEGEEEIANISFLIPVMPLDDQKALIDEIRADLDPPEGLTAEVVGLPVLAADANSELSGSRYWLTLLSLIAVALVLLAVYRSARRALVPLIPIVLATGWSGLILAAIQIPLNPMSATLGVLVIAVATEFSVILAARYEEERKAGRSIGEALRHTYERTGTAVLASGITSIAGFGVLVVSGITMLRDFGFVTIVDLSVSLAGVMVVLPATLVWAENGFRPFPALLGRISHRGGAAPGDGVESRSAAPKSGPAA